MSDNFPGPLPTFDSNAELQKRSFLSLCALLKDAAYFLPRDERGTDYGTDMSLELLVNGCPTNFRAPLQLKGVKNVGKNQDGSISKQIAVSNVNYLLNGNSPLYVLYEDTSGFFWFAWVHDERQRLDQENPGWMSQVSVIIRFNERLTHQTLRDIYNRILKAARFSRQIIDLLATGARTEHIKLAIDLSTLEVTDPKRAEEILLNNGLTLVETGMSQKVLQLSDLLPYPRRLLPRIQLVLGYTYFMLGRYQSALGHVSEAAASKSTLSDTDCDVLFSLRDACECLSGRITHEQFTERKVRAAADASASMRLARQHEAVRFLMLSERNNENRRNLLARLRNLTDEMLADDYSDGMKLQARIQLAYAEGHEQVLMLNEEMALIRIRIDAHQDWALHDRTGIEGAIAGLAKWEKLMDFLVSQAKAMAIPTLYAEALRTRLVVRTAVLGGQRFRFRFLRLGEAPVAADLKAPAGDAAEAIKVFQSADHIEGELHTKMLLADLLDMADDIVAAKRLAHEVMPRATAYGLARVEQSAQAHIAGQSLHRLTEAGMVGRREIDQDQLTAAISDQKLDDNAQMILKASKLPTERLPIIRRDIEAFRQIARERIGWCRHIELIQNLWHSQTPQAAYAIDPDRFGRCRKHKYESLQACRDAATVIARFKKSYCDDCPDRKPKLLD